jgi:hypothetical protein
MKYLLVISALAVTLIFGLSSVSQSYAAARQAQANIESSRTAQIAIAGNLVVIATLAILLLTAVAIIAYLLLRTRQPSNRQAFKSHTSQISETDINSMLPSMLTLMVYQMMQNQSQHSEQDVLFRDRYDADYALNDPDEIPWTI